MKPSNIPYQITAMTMAFLMFFTSVGFVVDMHYCQGQLKTFDLFGKAKSCHEVGEGMKNCPHHKKMMAEKQSENTTISKKDCCSNKTLYVQSDQDQQIHLGHPLVISSQLQHFILAFVETFLESTFRETDHPTYAHYKSPLIPRDIYVLLETYLL